MEDISQAGAPERAQITGILGRARTTAWSDDMSTQRQYTISQASNTSIAYNATNKLWLWGYGGQNLPTYSQSGIFPRSARGRQ
ncbi:hypothetical protein NO2_0409 [Candidatus Termititenax persephonae]|uniref:Uncharacterized protein n=1 Tax=Candidatus Termititenax persephonae TaxID=2218525 RepID=A0A388TFF0_9BACT|nr:hypothetical protein NO2_0409 [Candidatus Termititenax persephonae]